MPTLDLVRTSRRRARLLVVAALAIASCAAGCATTVDEPLAGTYDFRTDVRTKALAAPLEYTSATASPELGRPVVVQFGPVRTTSYGEQRWWLWVGFVDWEPFTLKRAIPPRLRLVADGRVLAEPRALSVDASLPLSRPPYAGVPPPRREQYYEIDAGELAALAGHDAVRLEIADGLRPWLAFDPPARAARVLDAFVDANVRTAVAAR